MGLKCRSKLRGGPAYIAMAEGDEVLKVTISVKTVSRIL